MIKYNTKEAYDFYRKFVNNKEKIALLTEHNLQIAGSVSSIDWELFGAILTGDAGKKGYGADLENHEVKSAVSNGSFEYQYHLHGGKQKLLDDMQVGHIFVSYSPDYQDMEVRTMPGEALKVYFESWMPGLITNYEGETPKQRYRKAISNGIVKKEGTLIMKVEKGKLVLG